MSRLSFILPVLLACLVSADVAQAAVELAWSGSRPHRIEEVYNRDGVPYLAVEDVLSALRLRGRWHSVEHRFRFRTPSGVASIFPGGNYLEIDGRFIPLDHPPLFIDGRLRVAEDFVIGQLPGLVGRSVYYRNLDPPEQLVVESDNPIDQLFALLLRKKQSKSGPRLRAVAIDVGHGGEDPGTIGLHGTKEKDVALAFARQLEKLLKMRLGVDVYLSRDGDYSLDGQQRLRTVLDRDVDLFILLHAQGHFASGPHGVELYIRPQEEFSARDLRQERRGGSRRLAAEVRQSLLDEGFAVSEVRQAGLLPLGRGDLPTVMLELGYLTNPDDLALLTDPEARQMLAEAVVEGVERFGRDQRSVK
ncbi:N-acetylmuramoyl-L-alanine amidase [Geothermobacter ehrlichii]|uniref:N-acetylmuramoyl-L-alanine amidase n=1 Tax=Geothermobacter ehrlichii TaxID=213224 RepID=A0A5D3WN89_9BACT|nr:N-acetylmuramoyl-L-alanine amidase [Geothermobacter ehrlichii]TYO98795.1 N-acetylmuramoyl-L-alanine amidase [Geothermobacter ehrlichii]